MCVYVCVCLIVSSRLVFGGKKQQPILSCHFDRDRKTLFRSKKRIHLAFFSESSGKRLLLGYFRVLPARFIVHYAESMQLNDRDLIVFATETVEV